MKSKKLFGLVVCFMMAITFFCPEMQVSAAGEEKKQHAVLGANGIYGLAGAAATAAYACWRALNENTQTPPGEENGDQKLANECLLPHLAEIVRGDWHPKNAAEAKEQAATAFCRLFEAFANLRFRFLALLEQVHGVKLAWNSCWPLVPPPGPLKDWTIDSYALGDERLEASRIPLAVSAEINSPVAFARAYESAGGRMPRDVLYGAYA
ncbi:MAG: hypothetical protein LBJ38_02065 [Oscillospiraceae bacterium]|jgi:hypothetical protein|nr:hypothetical protein [Oscillospiraceae bacterium]